MKYTPKEIPEGINTSNSHPLKELTILLGATALIIAVLVYIIILSTDYLVKFIPFEVEQKMFDFEISEFYPAEKDAALEPVENYVADLVTKLQASHGDKEFTFSVHVLKNDTPNAYAYPGGHIGVTTGLLNLLESENGLAMVLGHEMGHHYGRDPIKGIGRGVILALLLYSLGITDSDAWVQGIISDVTMIGVMNFNRDQERGADAIGKSIIEKYYGHTAGSSEFFEKMEQLDVSGNEVSWLSSHPSTQERLSALDSDEPGKNDLTPLPDYLSSTLGKQVKPIEHNSEKWKGNL